MRYTIFMLKDVSINKKTLEKELVKAEKAHGAYEKKLGKRDANWPRWYASFIVEKLQTKSRSTSIRRATTQEKKKKSASH